MKEYPMPAVPDPEREHTIHQHIIQPDQAAVRKAFATTYVWMILGLLVSAAVAFIFAQPELYPIVDNPFVLLALFLAELVVVVLFTRKLNTATIGTLRGMFLLYSVLTGATLATLATVWNGSTIFAAFLVSAIYFGCLSLMSFFSKIRLDKIGPICLVGLVALIICEVIMLIFHFSAATQLFSAIGLILFTGITAWDVYRMNKTMQAVCASQEWLDRLGISFALELYLDFINIFLRVLALIGNGSSSSRK